MLGFRFQGSGFYGGVASRRSCSAVRQYLYICTSKASELSTSWYVLLLLLLLQRLRVAVDDLEIRALQRRLRQYLYICTSKASRAVDDLETRALQRRLRQYL